MLTASFARCEMDGGWKRSLPGMELEGHSIKTDACKARHLSGEMIRLSRHEREHMYDTIWMVETRLPSTPNEMNSTRQDAFQMLSRCVPDCYSLRFIIHVTTF